MASSWIKWAKGLAKRREVLIVARRLNLSRKVVASTLMEVWEWADDETCDGQIRGAVPSDLDAVAETPGFSEAMLNVGWLRVTGSGLVFPKWDSHNSESAKLRARNAKNKANSRKNGVTVMSPSSHRKAGTREEREREREFPKGISQGKQSGRDSPSDSPASPDPMEVARMKARMHWMASVERLFSTSPKQRFSDITSSERMFDELIWPDDTDDQRSPDRYRTALDIMKRSTGRTNRMAWITKVINEELT